MRRNGPNQLVIAVQNLPPTLDPHAFAGLSPRRFGLFEALPGQREDGSLEPALAASWQAIDPTTWRFALAAGREFHDRSPVTAADVKASFDRVMDPARRLPALGRIATVREVRVVDAKTIDILTITPDPLLAKRVAQIAILPRGLAERPQGADWSGQAIGSGPYRLRRWTPNDRLQLDAFPEHPARPAIPQVVVRQINDNTARLAALRSGEADIVSNVPLDQADAVRPTHDLLIIDTGASAGFFLDSTTEGPLRDRRVRQALNYAVDKEAILRTVYHGLGKIEQGQVAQPETFGFNPALKPYPFDPKRAKSLLSEAGYPTGLQLRMDVFVNGPEVRDSALAVQSQLREVGVEVDLQVQIDQAAFLDRLYGRAPRGDLMAISLINAPLADADPALSWFRSNAPPGLRRHGSAAFDAAYLPSTTEMDESKRRDELQQAASELYEDPPYLFLVQAVWVWASAKGIQGIERRADLEPRPERIRKS